MKSMIISAAAAITCLFTACNDGAVRDRALAKIGNSTVLQSELDFAISTVPNFRRAGDPNELRNNVLQSLIDIRLQAEAARSYVGDPQGTVSGRLAANLDRDLSRIYFQVYLQENLGATDSELETYFKAHKAEILADSTLKGIDSLYKVDPAAALQQAKPRVAEKFALSRNADTIQAWFQTNIARFTEKDGAEIRVITSPDSNKLVQAVAELASGASIDSVAMRVSSDTVSAKNGGKIGLIRDGDFRREVSRFNGYRNLLFDKPNRIAVGKASPILSYMDFRGKDTVRVYGFLWVDSYQDAKAPEFASLRPRAEQAWLTEFRTRSAQEAPQKLREKYKVELQKIEPPDAQKWWEANKQSFLTEQAYHVLHIELSDSARLAAAIQGVTDEAAFRAKAAEVSENSYTKAKSGDVGVVKVSHCLPWGIGMMPELFSELAGRSKGSITKVLRAPDTQKFQVFYLLESIAPAPKPYDRAAKAVKDRIKASGDFQLDSAYVLVTADGKPILREKDVMALRDEVPPMQRASFPRERLLQYLVDWYTSAREARSLGLDRGPQYLALVHLREADVWASVFRDSVMNATLGQPQSELRADFARDSAKYYVGRPYEQARLEVALRRLVPEASYQREFVLHSDRYPGANGWEAARDQIFANIRDAEVRPAQMRLLQQLRKEIGVKIYDTTFVDKSAATAAQLYSDAKAAYEKRQLAPAKEAYSRIKDLFPGDTLVPHVYMNLAQIYTEEERYQAAADEYNAMAVLFPNHPDAFKALFMKGFIYAENLKKDSLALAAFEDLLKRFPNTEYTDDAQWMIENIRSGGKKQQALLDSIAKLDSLQGGSVSAQRPVAAPNATVSQPSGETGK